MRRALLLAVLVSAPVSAAAAEELAPSDPNADRALLGPTAMVQPDGRLAVSGYAGQKFLAGGVTWAPGPSWQVGFTGVHLFDSDGLGGMLSVKTQVVTWPRLKLAAIPFASTISQEHTNWYWIGAAGAASYCVDPGCASVATLFAAPGWYAITGSVDDGGGHRSVVMPVGLSAVARVAPGVKLLGEAVIGAELACNDTCTDSADLVMAGVGVRFEIGDFAGDMVVMWLFESDVDPLGALTWSPR